MSGGLPKLRERKQALIAEAESGRAAVVRECRALKAHFAWVGATGSTLRQFRPLLMVLAPVAGYLLVRRRGEKRSILASAFSGWRMVRLLTGIWKAFKSPRE